MHFLKQVDVKDSCCHADLSYCNTSGRLESKSKKYFYGIQWLCNAQCHRFISVSVIYAVQQSLTWLFRTRWNTANGDFYDFTYSMWIYMSMTPTPQLHVHDMTPAALVGLGATYIMLSLCHSDIVNVHLSHHKTIHKIHCF